VVDEAVRSDQLARPKFAVIGILLQRVCLVLINYGVAICGSIATIGGRDITFLLCKTSQPRAFEVVIQYP
jgi:hypothetical protein